MESTTNRAGDEQGAEPAAEFAAELAKTAPEPAAKKPAPKRKPAAKRKPSSRAQQRAAAKAARSKGTAPKPEPVAGVPEIAAQSQPQPVPLELAGIGLELAEIVTGYGVPDRARFADTQGESIEATGLTLEEISTLLVSRERRGFDRGHEMGYAAARQAALVRLQRERSEAVAGALMMVARQLEEVLHDLARSDAEGKAEGARHLALLVGEFAKAADRFGNGEEIAL